MNEAASSIIGRFGVGFYSVFMVADSVRVFSRHSGSEDAEGAGWCWTSTGDGSYSLAKASNVRTGTKIEITLKEGAAEFASRYNLERIIRKHSSFVTYPVLLHGERINNVEPVWMKAKKDVSTEEHEELYRHLSHAYDSPMCVCTRARALARGAAHRAADPAPGLSSAAAAAPPRCPPSCPPSASLGRARAGTRCSSRRTRRSRSSRSSTCRSSTRRRWGWGSRSRASRSTRARC